MKRIIKKLGILLLLTSLLIQPIGSNVYAAENVLRSTEEDAAVSDVLENEELPEEEKEREETVKAEDIDLNDSDSIIPWIEENIPEDLNDLADMSQEWWDSLLPNQRKVAESLAAPIHKCENHYYDQSVEEIVSLIETGAVTTEDFFEQTVFSNTSLEHLKALQSRNISLDDIADIIFGLFEGKALTEDEELLELAVEMSGYSPISSYAYTPQPGDEVAYMTLTSTGITDGYGKPLWRIRNGGENVFCMDHGKSCSRSYAYGNFHQSTGAAEYLIQYFGHSSDTDGYIAIQMAVWALQVASTEEEAYSYAYTWYLKSHDSEKAAYWANVSLTWYKMANGKSGTITIAEGPAGSQRPGKPTEFSTVAYNGQGGGDGGEEPELVEPEFASIEDSIEVTYEVKVRKTDWQTNVGLEGCKADIFENGSKVATVTTNAGGSASFETSKSASFSAEYCTNYDQLTPEQQAGITCFTSLEEAEADIESQKSDFANTEYTYSCREVTAPTGYVWQPNEKSVSVRGNGSGTLNITNERTLGAVELVKFDTESESDTTQGEATLDGAVYGIYAAENIVHQDKKTGVIFQKDELITTATIGKSPKRNGEGYILNTDGNRHIANKGGTIAYVDTPGKTAFADLELGKYYIREIKPSEGYMLDETVYEVTFTYKDQMVKVEMRDENAKDADNELTVDDDSSSKTVFSGDYVIKQGIQFMKTSDNAYQTELRPIADAGFKIYLISELSGVKNGTLTPLNGIWGADDIMTFYEYDFTDEQAATLYKRIGHEEWTEGDKKWLTKVEESNKYQVAEMFTDADGCIETPELPYGVYVCVETTVPEYHTSAKPFIISISQDGGVLYTDAAKQTIEKTYTDEEGIRYGDHQETKDREGRQLQKQRIINNTITETYLRIVKADEEFLVKPGTYIKAEEVVRGTVLKEGAEYRLRCLTFDISEESLKALNWKYDGEGYLSFYDPGAKEFMGTSENPFTISFLRKGGKITDSYITLPQELPVGSYELTEITAPEGYVVNGSEQAVINTGNGRENGYKLIDEPHLKVVFTINNGSVYPDGQMGTNKYALKDQYGNLTVTVLQENQEQKGIIEIYKHGEQLSAIKKDTKHQDFIFEYEDAPVEGAQFDIVAAEDIYTQEVDKKLFGQYARDLSTYLLHNKGDVVATITTDRNGWGYASGLYIGKYKIVETIAGSGFVLNTTETEFEITAQEQTVNFDIQSADYENQRQKLELSVEKFDRETKEALEGAVYGVYAAEDIYTNIVYSDEKQAWVIRDTPEIAVAKDILIATCVTGKDGKAVFDEDLPLAKLYVKELEAPVGYLTAIEDVMIDGSYTGNKGGQEVEVQKHTATFTNLITNAVISKKDLTNSEELEGAELKVYEIAVNEQGELVKENGEYQTTLIESWISQKETHIIKGLQIGRTYILRETKPAAGYVTAEEILFCIQQETDADGKLTEIAGMYSFDGTDWQRSAEDVLVMLDDVTKLQISKKDLANAGELPGAALEVYDKDGNLLHTWVSSEKPHDIEKLPIGTYRLVEKKAPSDYSYAEDIIFEIKDTEEIQTVTMYDDVQKLDVEKSTISVTERGDTYKYIVDTVKNRTDSVLDKFTLTDKLPEAVRLTELWTGTYNQKQNYLVEYQTNKNTEWTVWEENLDTEKNHHLTVPKSLQGEEYITSFRICFGTVGGLFSKVENLIYFVKVEPDASGILKNVIELSAELEGIPYKDKDETETLVETPEPKEPPTSEKDEPEIEEPEERKNILTTPGADTGDPSNGNFWIVLMIFAVITGICIEKYKKNS